MSKPVRSFAREAIREYDRVVGLNRYRGEVSKMKVLAGLFPYKSCEESIPFRFPMF